MGNGGVFLLGRFDSETFRYYTFYFVFLMWAFPQTLFFFVIRMCQEEFKILGKIGERLKSGEKCTCVRVVCDGKVIWVIMKIN